MKIYKLIRLFLVVVVIFLVSIANGQGAEPDSQYRLVPIPTLEIAYFGSEPIDVIGDVLLMREHFYNPKNTYEINGKPIAFTFWGVNYKTNKFLFVDGISEKGYRYIKSRIDTNSYYLISEDKRKLYKVKIGNDTITSKIIYQNDSNSIYAIAEYNDELVIAEGYHGLRVLRQDHSVRKFIPYKAEYSTLVQYDTLMVFGGYSFGVIFSINIENGVIEDIRYNTGTINGAFLTTINNKLYADVDGELFKFNGKDEWSLIVSEINPFTLKKNCILREYTLRTKVGEDYIFRNDSLISIPVSPFEHIEYIEEYRYALYKKYGSNMGFGAWFIFPLNGKIWGVGDGMVGTVEKVLIPNQDTVSTSIRNLESKVSIFPNPTGGKLFIYGLYGEHMITIINSIGVNVYKSNVVSEIDLKHLSSGIYLIQIEGLTPKKIVLCR